MSYPPQGFPVPGDNELFGLLPAGLAAARPAAGIAGRMYFSTDTLVLERDTGAGWVEVARGETAIRLAQLVEKAHASLTGVTSDQHHARSHNHSLAADGTPIAEAGVPAHMAKGKLAWTADKLLKGAGAGADPTEIDVPGGATKEVWFPATNGTGKLNKGNHTGFFVDASGENAYIEMLVPHDFTALSSVVVVVICDQTFAGLTNYINIYSDYGSPGQAYNIHSELDESLQHSGVVATNIYEWSVASVLTSIVAGDYIGLRVVSKGGVSRTFTILGVRFKYS